MRERVLVVDDEAGVRASLAAILGDEGYAVDGVESGEAALTALGDRRYDLVLLDVWLPGRTASRCCRGSGSRTPSCPWS